MTTVLSPAATEWVIEPVSRSPAVRVAVAAASCVPADAWGDVVAAVVLAATPGLIVTSGKEQPASPPDSASTRPAPARLVRTVRKVMRCPPVVRRPVGPSGDANGGTK